jgi:hypothetical protein
MYWSPLQSDLGTSSEGLLEGRPENSLKPNLSDLCSSAFQPRRFYQGQVLGLVDGCCSHLLHRFRLLG